MDNFTKRPYEISLWDEQLIWERRILEVVQVLKDDYAPGKYYSQNSGAFGEVPFSLDFNEYNPGQRYYKLHIPQDNDTFEAVIEGERPEEVTVPTSWLVSVPQLRVCNILKFEEGQKYYTYSNETGLPAEVSTGLIGTPQEGVIYFKEETNTSMPNTLNSYYKEYKLCTIGSDTMEAPFRAISGKFTTKINGENVLNFSIYYKYMDAETGQLKSNPFLPYLVNERKIKLRIGELGKPDCRWYDLIIKQIQENSENKTFQYTCKDQFVNELSKTGFELVFDNERENNMGTVTYLGENILEGSDWRIGKDNAILHQYIEEPLYEIKLKIDSEINAVDMLSPDKTLTISGGSTIFVFYSHINEKNVDIQFLYAADGQYEKDDDLIIDKDYHKNYIVRGVRFEGELPEWAQSCLISEECRGMRLVRQATTKYDSIIDKYVSVYEKTIGGETKTYYGFTKDEYLSPQAVFNYVVTPNSFTSTTGWAVEKIDGERSPLTITTYPMLGTEEIMDLDGKEIKTYLTFTNIPGARLVNSSFSNHRTTLTNMNIGDIWMLRMKHKKMQYSGSMPLGVTGNYSTDAPSVFVAKYDITPEGAFEVEKEGLAPKKIIDFSVQSQVNLPIPNDIDEEGQITTKEHYIYMTGEVLYALSEAEIKDYKNRFGLFFDYGDFDDVCYIEDVELFPYVTYSKDDEDYCCVPGGDFFSETRQDYYYYLPDKTLTNPEDLKYEAVSQGAPDLSFIRVYNDGEYTKTRSIDGKESNRFNLIQDLCEKFECWALFHAERDMMTGEIYLGKDVGKFDGDEAYRQQKFVTFKEYLQDEYNWAGFRYGVNSKSIQRTIDSGQIVSKMIVKDNANEFAKNGFCSIARAQDNDIKENFLINFDHYYRHKLLSLATVTNDLYVDSNGYIGYYKLLRQKNAERDALIEEQANLLIDLMHYDSSVQTYKTSYEAAVEEKQNIENYIRDLTGGGSFAEFAENFRWSYVSFNGLGDFDPNTVYYEYNHKTGEYYRTKDPYAVSNKQYAINESYAKWDCNKEFLSYWAQYCQVLNIINQHEPIYKKAEKQFEEIQAKYDAITAKLDRLTSEKRALNLRFYKKYSRFLQEGSWISEDYVDDNLYYLDAKSTLHTSAQPKVTYNISVLELSRLPGYENYKFELGDRTYIEDVEFFGYSLKDGVTPYREEIVINEISLELDSPEKNSIKVQNYKTQFDDLFSRITASTQQVEYHSGEYQRAASIVEEDGTITAESIEKSFQKNAISLNNAKDQSVVIDNYGITTSSTSKPDQLVRIISGGIYISNDGGQTWRTGITGAGVNTSVLTSGQLNTEEVLITSGESPSFRWNSQGINAFYIDADGTYDPARFVRFDQYGIYGLNGTAHHKFDVTEENEKGLRGEERIWDEAQYALTWKGFMLKRTGADNGYVSISSVDDFIVHDGTNQRVKIGNIGTESKPNYGIKISNGDGMAVIETNEDGTLWLKNQLNIETYSGAGSKVLIGKLDTPATKDQDHGGRVIDANEKFIVYEDGHMKATGAEFEGRVVATDGYIGGVTVGQVEGAVSEIDGISEKVKKLDILAKKGYNFKVESGEIYPSILPLEAVPTNFNIKQIVWEGCNDWLNWQLLQEGGVEYKLTYELFDSKKANGTYYIRVKVISEEGKDYSQWATFTTAQDGAKGDKGDKGEDAITLSIGSSGGFMFKNGQGTTTLTARVFQGTQEIDTDPDPEKQIYKYIWTDPKWPGWSAGGKTIQVDATEVDSTRTFVCSIELKEEKNG